MRIQYVFYLNIISIKRKKYYYIFNIKLYYITIKIKFKYTFFKKINKESEDFSYFIK